MATPTRQVAMLEISIMPKEEATDITAAVESALEEKRLAFGSLILSVSEGYSISRKADQEGANHTGRVNYMAGQIIHEEGHGFYLKNKGAYAGECTVKILCY